MQENGVPFDRCFRILVIKRCLISVMDSWHRRYVREQHARSVVGVDMSRNMLERARLMTDDTNIEYVQSAIEDYDYPANEFDVVISSLALHYIRDFEDICKKVYQSLTVGGSFVFSVEHPVFTAVAEQDWYYSRTGRSRIGLWITIMRKAHANLDFFDHDVTKYHRSIATQINALVKTGFQFRKCLNLNQNASRFRIRNGMTHTAAPFSY